MHSKRELHKALEHASKYFERCADAFTSAEDELKKDNPDMDKVKIYHKDCKTQYLFGKCILDKLNEGELLKNRKDDKISEDFNKEITKNMGDQ